MELQIFLNAVAGMRKHQKAYFRDRKQSDLIEAKKFEKTVDQGLVEGVRAPVEPVEKGSGQSLSDEQIMLFE